MSHNLNGWIIGTGPIGQEYAKILSHLNVQFKAIGRSDNSGANFQKETGHHAIGGGCDQFLQSNPAMPDFAIVAVTANQLAPTAISLLKYGVKKILLEKPGAMNRAELEEIQKNAHGAAIYIAYNRRYFSSVQKAKQIIAEDGGIRSFHFDFTEWPSRILSFEHPDGVLENWFYMNSTHAVDLAFHLGGWPKNISCSHAGKLDWHTPAVFSGSGTSIQGAPFSYKADWASAGRWSVEVTTAKRKMIFAPMEQLKEQRLNDVAIYDLAIDDASDKEFKPGFLMQTQSFLEEKPGNDLLPLKEQIDHWRIYEKIKGDAS